MPFFISIFFWLIVYLVIRNACANRALIYTKQEYSVTIIVEYFTQVLANSNAIAKDYLKLWLRMPILSYISEATVKLFQGQCSKPMSFLRL